MCRGLFNVCLSQLLGKDYLINSTVYCYEDPISLITNLTSWKYDIISTWQWGNNKLCHGLFNICLSQLLGKDYLINSTVYCYEDPISLI